MIKITLQIILLSIVLNCKYYRASDSQISGTEVKANIMLTYIIGSTIRNNREDCKSLYDKLTIPTTPTTPSSSSLNPNTQIAGQSYNLDQLIMYNFVKGVAKDDKYYQLKDVKVCMSFIIQAMATGSCLTISDSNKVCKLKALLL